MSLEKAIQIQKNLQKKELDFLKTEVKHKFNELNMKHQEQTVLLDNAMKIYKDGKTVRTNSEMFTTKEIPSFEEFCASRGITKDLSLKELAGHLASASYNYNDMRDRYNGDACVKLECKNAYDKLCKYLETVGLEKIEQNDSNQLVMEITEPTDITDKEWIVLKKSKIPLCFDGLKLFFTDQSAVMNDSVGRKWIHFDIPETGYREKWLALTTPN